jgi:hypothetical protein
VTSPSGAPTRAQLQPLIDGLAPKLIELFCGRIKSLYRAHYEIACAPNASATLHELAAAIEALSAAQRRAWRAATVRDFNVGVELAGGVRSVELAVDSDAIRRVARLGGRIAFTAYTGLTSRSRRASASRTARSRRGIAHAALVDRV